jgi:glycosyltransferase involved in cell wall biosynthesis
MNCSIIIPIYNEADNLDELLKRLKDALKTAEATYEIIAVNDGSSDNTWQVLEAHAKSDKNLKIISFRRNYGQTAAIMAGISLSSGDVIIPIDADLENDPADIPLLLLKLNEGHDVVSGWRKNRWRNKLLTRKLPSIMANKLISWISGVRLSDYGCTLKAYRRDVIAGLQLYGEMHRFIPAYAAWNGARVTEIIVSHKPRVHGRSNYGISRTFRVILDLLLIKFLTKYMNRPIHFFGEVGFFAILLGTIAGLVAVFLRLFYDFHLVQTPLPIFSALLIIVGVQLMVMGILAEIIMRTYYESQQKTSYVIKDRINFEN